MENIVPILPITFTGDFSQQMITVPSSNVQRLQRSEYLDTFNFWQALTGLFSYMKLNTSGKYTINKMKAKSLLLNQYRSCAGYTANGGIVNGKQEFDAIPHYFFDTFCDDELLNSCFEALIQWRENGSKDMMSPEAVEYFDEIVRTWQAGAAQSLRNTLAIANLHDLDSAALSPDATNEDKNQLKSANLDLLGYIALQNSLANEYPNLDVAGSFNSGDFTDDGVFTGDVLAIVDDYRSASSSQLSSLIVSGISNIGVMSSQAVIVASPSFYHAVVRAYNTQQNQLMTNGQRITKTVETAAGITQNVYRIDGMVVVPLAEVSALDHVLLGNTHYFGIWTSGNVNLGTSFSSIPRLDNIGLQIVRNTNVIPVGVDENGQTKYDYGRISALSHALLATAIADPTMNIGHTVYREPA